MNDDTNRSAGMPDEFDRLLGQLDGLPGHVKTKPVVIRVTPMLGVGGSATYGVTTYRQAGEVISAEGEKERRSPASFTVFLEIVDGSGRAKRIVLPDAVATLIARQRDGLTAIAMRRSAQQGAATRKASGHVPTFGRKRARS